MTTQCKACIFCCMFFGAVIGIGLLVLQFIN